jgi:hypothetical protein
MSDLVAARAPAWLRIVAGLGLIWNLIGVYFYLVAVGIVAAPQGYDRSMAEAMPAWVVGCFALAVFAGTLGSLGLLMLKRWSKLLLLLSFLAVAAQSVWAFALSGSPPSGSAMVLPLLVLLISIVLVWLAYSADRKGWLS